MSRLRGVAWDDLAVVLAVLEHGSLNRAARALGTSQSTASRRLVRLEAQLGSTLFDRTPEGLAPTVLAHDLAPHAALVAGHMADIERLAESREVAPRGRVRMAVVDGLAAHLVVPGLPRLRASHPGIELDLLSGQAVLDLVRREAELALRFVPPTAPDLVVRRLFGVPVAPFVRPELADVPSDMLPWLMLYDPDRHLAESRWIDAHARPSHCTAVSAWSDLFAAVCSGVGAALVPPWVARPAGLVPVQGFEGVVAVEHTLLLVYHRAQRDVPRVRAVREWVVSEVDRRLEPSGRTDASSLPQLQGVGELLGGPGGLDESGRGGGACPGKTSTSSPAASSR